MYDLTARGQPLAARPDQVSSGRDLGITFGVDSMATLTLTVFIDLPDVTPMTVQKRERPEEPDFEGFIEGNEIPPHLVESLKDMTWQRWTVA